MKRILALTGAACLSGVLLFLSHPPLAFWFTAWFAFLPLMLAVGHVRKRWFAFLLGWLCGIVFYATSISWIEIVIGEYSDLPDPLPWLGMFILAAYMSLYPALFALALQFSRKMKTDWRLLWLAAAWVCLEWLQAVLLTGFPWNLLGYSQIHFPVMIQVADLGGVYLVSFLVIVINLLLYHAWQERKGLAEAGKAPAFLLLAALVVTGLVYGLVQLVIPYEGETRLTAAVIQDDLDNAGRWQLRRQDPLALYRYYESQALQALDQGAEVILWGEGAFMYLDMMRENGAPPWRSSDFEELSIFSLVQDNDFWLLMGSNDYINDGDIVFNTAVTIAPDHDGTVTGRYAKVHLTPFGEYVPFTAVFGWLDKIVPEISDFAAGENPHPIPLKEGLVGVPICYEVIFPDLVRQFVNQGATILATISNDAWFGRSAANQQHFNMAAFRAVENRRYLMRCAVSGISGFVSPHGKILHQTPIYERRMVTREVAMLQGKTVYAMVGDIFVLICILVVFLLYLRLR